MLSFRFISGSEDFTPRLVTSYDGYAAADFEQNIQDSGMGDGGMLGSTRIPPRYLSLSFDVQTDDEREKVIRLFSPRKMFTHIVSRGNISRQITVYVSAMSISQETIYDFHRVKLSLVCPDPYFYSIDDYGRDIARVTPQFAFPLAFSPSIIAGYSDTVNDIALTNEGHDICGLQIRIVANNDCSNITVTNTDTGEYIRFIGELLQGQVLEISTVPKQKYVRLNGVNAMNRIDRRSCFFSLETGVNHINYDTDTGRYNIAVYLHFKRRFLGV